MGPSLGFVSNVWFFFGGGGGVDLCYILWSVLLHHLFCIEPLDLYCASVSQYYVWSYQERLYFFTFFAICPSICSLLLQ